MLQQEIYILFKKTLLFLIYFFKGNLLTIFGMDRIGPRAILTMSLLFNAVACLALFFAPSAWESFVISCFFSAVSVFCWNSLNIVNTCYFPIEIRSTATGFFNGKKNTVMQGCAGAA